MENKIETRMGYDALMLRFDTLALSIEENIPTNADHPIYIEMNFLANLLEEYEAEHFILE